MIASRAAAVWLLLLTVAVAVAVLRQGLMVPHVGELRAHQLGSAVVIVLFVVVIWGTIRWVVPSLERSALWRVGGWWLVATVLFEFGFGRWVAGHTWARLLADYDLAAGRLWTLVLLTVFGAPVALGRRESARRTPRVS